MKRKQIKKYSWIIFVIPLILGTHGYLQTELFANNFWGALYSTVRLYSINIDVPEADINGWIQIARWIAVLATAAFVAKILKTVMSEIGVRVLVQDPEAIVIHGNGPRRDAIAEAMMTGDRKVIVSDPNSNSQFNAPIHVLAFEKDTEALKYLREHEKELPKEGFSKKKIYLCSYDLEESDYTQTGVVVSNHAVNCARQYWQQNWLGKEKNQNEYTNVAIVGFGKYGKRMLEQALLVNIMADRPSVYYHIYGTDGTEYCQWHSGLVEVVDIYQNGKLYEGKEPTGENKEKRKVTGDRKRDQVYFHSWLDGDGIDMIKQMDRVIIAMDEMEDNILCLNKLLFAGVQGKIHVRCSETLLEKAQYVPESMQYRINEDNEKEELLKVTAFGNDADLYSRDVLLNNGAYIEARKTHTNYVKSCMRKNIKTSYGSCKTCDKKEDELCGDCLSASKTWDDLTLFEKASNLAVADHLMVKRMMIAELADRVGVSVEQLYNYFGSIDVEKWPNWDASLIEAKRFLGEQSDQIETLHQGLVDLLRVEHERWCRFHFVHNWHYGEKKNKKLRIHNDLLPFDMLPFAEQKKDWFNYRLFFSEPEIVPIFNDTDETPSDERKKN